MMIVWFALHLYRWTDCFSCLFERLYYSFDRFLVVRASLESVCKVIETIPKQRKPYSFREVIYEIFHTLNC